MSVKRLCTFLSVLSALTLTISPGIAGDDVVLSAMQKELNRSFSKLKTEQSEANLYFLAYRLYDTHSIEISAEYGGLTSDKPESHKRVLDIEVRVGSPKIDNTHQTRGGGMRSGDFLSSRTPIPLDDDEAALRTTLWERTDAAYKAAQADYQKVLTNRDVRIAEEDNSDDFSKEKPAVYMGKPIDMEVDRAAWEERLRKLSAIYKTYPNIKSSMVRFSATKTRRYLVTSEGTTIGDDHVQYRIYTIADATADDGMRVWLYDGVEAPTSIDLPDDQKLETMVRKVASSVEALRVAKAAEPFAGPAILQAKSAGVYFHEIFGHRIEGHRQKDEGEGRTFTKLIGKEVMPTFISVVDDPLKERLGTKALNGFYRYDDEGVPAQKVVLVDKGILRNYLMERSPVKGFPVSNGHGRSSPGSKPVARQANLIVESSKKVPYETLREQLIAEVKRQGKPYGLVFDEIAGGFTMTQAFMPQVFKLKPLRVWRVFPDGRPDELLRGVDLVGTPLTSLERILGAGDDDDVFNGTCGAESGWVPVSAISPSLLVQTIEVERNIKEQDKPPVLPPPDRDISVKAETSKDSKPGSHDDGKSSSESKSADKKEAGK
ncbi:MAG TPA: metallopeptidase TldD-related protein [Drouetiella sp.]